MRITTGAVAGLIFSALCAGVSASSGAAIAEAARERLQHQVKYDGSYQALSYPLGDVANERGVCSDLVRGIGIDLQRLVHEDMRVNFSAHPTRWGLRRPDRNIDHRRVPNLRRFLVRKGHSLPISSVATDYRPGDLVTWMLPGNLPYIGIVSSRAVDGGSRPLIVHNIGAGLAEEDSLFRFKITGHYRFTRAH